MHRRRRRRRRRTMRSLWGVGVAPLSRCRPPRRSRRCLGFPSLSRRREKNGEAFARRPHIARGDATRLSLVSRDDDAPRRRTNPIPPPLRLVGEHRGHEAVRRRHVPQHGLLRARPRGSCVATCRSSKEWVPSQTRGTATTRRTRPRGFVATCRMRDWLPFTSRVNRHTRAARPGGFVVACHVRIWLPSQLE